MIDCREAIRRMWSYLDESLEQRPLGEFEEHLDTCLKCCGELEFSRHLRSRVASSFGASPVSPEVRARLDQVLTLAADAAGEDEA
jgi:anti-sigma factor (TIGR02949 family)